MYLLAHNANLVKIQSPAVPADAQKGIAGSPPAVKWQGIAQARMLETMADVVRGGRASAETRTANPTMMDIPANLPVLPDLEDLVTVQRLDTPQTISSSPDVINSKVQTWKVRAIDANPMFLGRVRLHVVDA